MNARRWLPLVLVFVAVLAVAALRNDDDGGAPLDPRGTSPEGARGLVLLLEQQGASVAIGDEPPELAAGGVALLLSDELGEDQSDDLREWVRAGGTLVVADPFSRFAPALETPDIDLFASEESISPMFEPRCGFPPVRGVDRISVEFPALLRVRDTDVACFPRGEGAYLVARAEGSGSIVALGSPEPFVNDSLADEDNALLAVGLLAPRPGTSVVVLEPAAAGSGQRTLLDLVSQDVSSALWQLAVVFLVVVLWRARRLGRPVVESDPVEVPGSELVLAVGNLLHRAKRRDAAAEMLRLQARRTLCERLGLPIDADDAVIADAAAGAGGLDRSVVLSALSPAPILDDASLVALATTVDSLRREVAHV